MDAIWDKLNHIAEECDGYIKTAQVERVGISRPMLKKYVDMGKLKRVRKGIYVVSGQYVDEYALLQTQNSKIIFSYGTALYLWDMSDRVPHCIDITVPQGSNLSVIKRDNATLRCHYVKAEWYDLGITQTKSPQGAIVRLYDKERCICDLIRHKDQVEMQLYTQAVNAYFKGTPNSRKLLKYGKIFGIEAKIRTLMEVLL